MSVPHKAKVCGGTKEGWLPLSSGSKQEVASEAGDCGRKRSLKAQDGQAHPLEVTQEDHSMKGRQV